MISCQNNNCSTLHEGTFGSGRFCSNYCARSFSTQENRELINEKVRHSMSGRKNPLSKGFQFTNDHRKKAGRSQSINHQRKLDQLPFDDLTVRQKRKRVFREQNHTCLHCENSEWLCQPIKLELDHEDGNKKNNSRENLRGLCPNCHSFTPTWRKQKPKIA